MTNFHIESTIIERLREQDLNATDLLQAHAKKRKNEAIIEYEIDDGLIKLMKKHDIDIVLEILAAIRKDIEMHGKGFEVKIVKKEQNETDNRMGRR